MQLSILTLLVKPRTKSSSLTWISSFSLTISLRSSIIYRRVFEASVLIYYLVFLLSNRIWIWSEIWLTMSSPKSLSFDFTLFNPISSSRSAVFLGTEIDSMMKLKLSKAILLTLSFSSINLFERRFRNSCDFAFFSLNPLCLWRRMATYFRAEALTFQQMESSEKLY